MKKTAFILILCLFSTAWAQQPNGKQRMTFKSIVIQNGDTLVTEKNIESDDPNARLSDSIPMQNGMFKFDFGGRDSNLIFQNFSDPFSSQYFNFEQFFESDSLFNSFFSNSFMADSSLFKGNFRFVNPSNKENNNSNLSNFNKSQEAMNHVSTFDIEVLPEINKINITFKLNPATTSILSVENQQGKIIFSEQIEPSQGYYVRQLDSNEFTKGGCFAKLIQGTSVFTKSISIQ